MRINGKTSSGSANCGNSWTTCRCPPDSRIQQDSADLTVGSTERFLAERRIQKLTQEAAGLGYETPGQELGISL